jgi:DNA-3-methyladenine glycosylase
MTALGERRHGNRVEQLDRPFFVRDTISVARDLLGQRLVRVLNDGQRLAGIIVETEAYIGEDDRACHAACGHTERNAIMYGTAGHAYVYFIYGMYHCLNIVSEREGFPAAVLLRALQPVEGLAHIRKNRAGRADHELASGPGRLCQALTIDLSFYGHDLCTSSRLFIERGPVPAVSVGPRIGIAADEQSRARPWRFFVTDNPFVSHQKKRASLRIHLD